MKKHLMAIIVMTVAFSLVGCGSKRDRAARIITQTLEDRYEEEFVIDSMGGGWGTSDDSRLKAWVYPEGNKDNMFKAQIKKDLSIVEDEYLNILMADKLTDELTPILESIYGNQFKAFVYTNSYISDIGFTDMELETFFKSEMYVSLGVDLFIKCEDYLDKEVELQALKDFSAQYDKALGEKGSLFVYYMKAPIFDELEIKRDDLDHTMQQYLSSTDHCYNYAEFVIPSSDEHLTIEQFRD